MQAILTPPFAFVIYFALAAILFGIGRMLAGKGKPSAEKSSLYASGEASPLTRSLPGYRGFFIIALFFAVLHLGALMLGTSVISPVMVVYLIGLALALVVLIIG
jgi:NADH:ubiquinone oxidoreductase subunit 3 (subunit A)